MNKPLIKRIECAYLPVRNVEASAAWYEKVLGLQPRSPIEPGKGAIMIMGGGLQLNFKDPDGNKFQAWQQPVPVHA
jgi:hypothetical protein